MKKGFFLPLLLLAAAAQTADDDARRCDLAGASFLDPQRPPAVAFRYFHSVYADVAAVNADAEACQRAYDQSKDPRYLYQAGNVYAGYFDEGSVRFAIGKMKANGATAPDVQVPDALSLMGAQQFMRGYFKQAANAGYAAARYGQAWAVRNEADSNSDNHAVFEGLMPGAPLLAHLGLADWHLQQIESDSAREAEHRAAAERHFREAVALNAGFLVAEVLDVQTDGNVILNTSAACHMPDVIEMPYRPPVIGAGEAGEKAHTYTLAGPTCLAGDTIGTYSFDAPLAVGDRVVFGDMAIYTMVKNNTFNGMPLPQIIAVPPSGAWEIVREFGYDDFKMRL